MACKWGRMGSKFITYMDVIREPPLAGDVGPIHETVPVAKEVDVRTGQSGVTVRTGGEGVAVVSNLGP